MNRYTVLLLLLAIVLIWGGCAQSSVITPVSSGADVMTVGDSSFLGDLITDMSKEPQEMALVTFVKHYNVKRADFEKVVSALKKLSDVLGQGYDHRGIRTSQRRHYLYLR
jgi:hypothetical protein